MTEYALVSYLELASAIVGGDEQRGACSVGVGLDISDEAGVGDGVCSVETHSVVY